MYNRVGGTRKPANLAPRRRMAYKDIRAHPMLELRLRTKLGAGASCLVLGSPSEHSVLPTTAAPPPVHAIRRNWRRSRCRRAFWYNAR